MDRADDVVGHVSSPRRITLSYYSRPYRIAPSVDREFVFCLAGALGTDDRKREDFIYTYTVDLLPCYHSHK